MPKVSVVVSAHNYEEFIGSAIKSVLNQTYKNFELIITDDASTDHTLQIIKSFKDSRIKIFAFPTNRGESAAENNGIFNSTGDYIAILNADDEFLPTKLEKQVSFLNSHPNITAVFTQVKVVDDNGDKLTDKTNFYYDIFKQHNRSRYEWLRRFFYGGNCLCHPSVMIRRSAYDNVGFYDERFVQIQDFHLWVRLCLKYNIFILPESLTKFRVGHTEKQISGNTSDRITRNFYEYKKVLEYYLKIENIDELLKIFPEIKKITNKPEKKFVPFYIAQLALKKIDPIHQYFAVDTLYSFLTTGKIIKDLNDKYDYSFSDFIKLTGKIDVTNIHTIRLFSEKTKSLNQEIALLKEQNTKLTNDITNLENILLKIKSANFFKLWQSYCKLRDSIIKK